MRPADRPPGQSRDRVVFYGNAALAQFVENAAVAVVAALAQTFIPRASFAGFCDTPLLPVFAMILLAFLLNLCSEADAFIAASFRGLVPTHAQLAFLLTGPMFDLKLLLMYRTLFTRRAIGVLSVLILLAVALAVAALGLAGKAGA